MAFGRVVGLIIFIKLINYLRFMDYDSRLCYECPVEQLKNAQI